MNLESTPQNNLEKTEPPKELTQERTKKLKKVRQILERFLLSGILFFGADIAKDHVSENYSASSLAEMIELADQEERDLIFSLGQHRVDGSPEILLDKIVARDGVINKESIQKFLNTLPQNWANGEVSSISYMAENNGLIGFYGDSLIATFTADTRKLEFNSSSSQKESRAFLFYVLAHEIGHGNDFLADSSLSWPERHNLFQSITKRLNEENHFRTKYLEMLKKDSEDMPGKVRLVREYWAEICGQYFTDPSQLTIEDFELVDRFILKNDPNYNWRETVEERQNISGPSATEHIVKK